MTLVERLQDEPSKFASKQEYNLSDFQDYAMENDESE
jgi:hypothetical protein